jgi:membrane-associated phospholipid phosphatase/tRNA A-37 threonylcarbamoyl transferase component Bud32
MDVSRDRSTSTSAPPVHPTLREAVRSPRRRRPTGAPPPLPYRLQTSGVGWLVAAVVLVGLALAVFGRGMRGPAITATVASDAVVRWLGGLHAPGLEALWQGLAYVGSWWTLMVLQPVLLLALLVLRRWRHLIVWLVAWILAGNIAAGLAMTARQPRPFGVELRTSWGGWAMPSLQVTYLAVLLVGILYTLVPEGRWRNRGKWVAAALVTLVGLARIALGVDAPNDVLVGAGIGVAVPLLLFRRFTPGEVFPVSYRRGRSAHLDIGGARGVAIRRALSDQLGLAVQDIKPFGLAGSAGSTPLRITVAGDPPKQLFGKLYAQSHLRADRWYKLGRELLYGRLEDEKPFNAVRRLVQQEDYALWLMQRAGLPSPTPYGFVELTPEREYLLVTEFFDGAVELGEAEVDDGVIDDGLSIVRKMWDAGLAHRDVKPANLLVRDGHLLLIDVAFAEARPSPWRQAVDLSNMMLCLALRSSPQQVYQRALRQFTVEEITEAFARLTLPGGIHPPWVALGLALPSQLRHMLRAETRDPYPEFVKLLPSPPDDTDPAVERPPGRAVGGDRGAVGPGGPEPDRRLRQPGGRQDPVQPPQPGLHAAGAAVADGPVGAVGLDGALRADAAARLDGRRRVRQQRPVGDHPGPRPGRQGRGRGTPYGRLRHHRRGGDADPGSRGPTPSAGRRPCRRVLRDLVRPVPGRLRHLPAALHQRPRGALRQRGAVAAGVHHPRGAPPGTRRALRRPTPSGPRGSTMTRPGVPRSPGPAGRG